MSRWLLVLLLACSRSVAPSAPHPAPVHCDDLRDDPGYHAFCMLASQADSTAALLSVLGDELRSNFTLVYETRSAERGVDMRHPRVILFSSDARLLVAFGATGDVLDVIHYRDAARRFEMERFVLPAAVRRDPALAALARENGQPDPVECRRCHGADPRPVFSSYSVWPGFYGSIRDRLAGAELDGYGDFLAHRKDPGSVYALLHFPPGSEVSPFALESANVPAAELAPNTRLGLALTELERGRIARRLESSPRYAQFRDKILAGLLGCEPMPIRMEDRARVRTAIAAESAAKLDHARVTDPDRRKELRMAELSHLSNMFELDYIARVLDVGTIDWSLELEPGSSSLYDGMLSGDITYGQRLRDFYFKEDVLLELLGDLAATDAAVAPFFALRTYTLYGRKGSRLDVQRAIDGCSVLSERSRAVEWPQLPAPAPAVASRCVRCHEPAGEGPPIPFASPSRLAATLVERPGLAAAIAARTVAGGRAAMPLGEPPLSSSEREALLAYIAAVL